MTQALSTSPIDAFFQEEEPLNTSALDQLSREPSLSELLLRDSEPDLSITESIKRMFTRAGGQINVGIGGAMQAIEARSRTETNLSPFDPQRLVNIFLEVESKFRDEGDKSALAKYGEQLHAFGQFMIDSAPPSQSVQEGGAFGWSNPRWWFEVGGENMIRMAPQIALAFATRGQSMATQTTAFATPIAIMEGGASYTEIRDQLLAQGQSQEEAERTAAGAAIVIGAGSAALEKFGPGAKFLLNRVPGAGKLFAESISRRIQAHMASRLVTSLTVEAMTEIGQEAWADVIEFASTSDPKAFDDWQNRYAGAAALAAGTAGTFEAAGGAIQNVNVRRARQTVQKAVDSLPPKSPSPPPETMPAAPEPAVEVTETPEVAGLLPEPTPEETRGLEPVPPETFQDVLEEASKELPNLDERNLRLVQAALARVQEARGVRETPTTEPPVGATELGPVRGVRDQMLDQLMRELGEKVNDEVGKRPEQIPGGPITEQEIVDAAKRLRMISFRRPGEGAKQAMRRAFFEGKREGKQEIQGKLDDFRAKLKSQKRVAKGMRAELRAIVRELKKVLPTEAQNKVLADASLANLRTSEQYDRFIKKRLLPLMRKVKRAKDIQTITKSIERIEGKDLRQQFQDEADALLKQADNKSLSQTKKDRLVAMAEFIKRNPDAFIPSKHTAALKRLRQTQIPDLSDEQIANLAEILPPKLALIELVSATTDKLSIRGKERAAEQVITEVVTEVFERTGSPFSPRETTPTGELAPEPGTPKSGRLTDQVKAFGELGKKAFINAEDSMLVDHLVRWLGGTPIDPRTGEQSATRFEMDPGTTTWEVLYGAIDRAQNDVWHRGKHMADDALASILNANGIDPNTREFWQMSQKMSSSMSSMFRQAQEFLRGEEVGPTTVTPDVVKIELVSEVPDTKVVAGPRTEQQLDRPLKKTTSRTQTMTMDRARHIHLLKLMQDPYFVEQTLAGSPIHLEGHPKDELFFIKSMADFDRIRQAARPEDIAIANGMVQYLQGDPKATLSKWSRGKGGRDITGPEVHVSIRRLVDQDAGVTDITTQNMIQKAIENADLTKDRVGGKQPIIVGDAFIEYSNVINTIYGLAAMDPTISAAQMVLNDPRFRNRAKESKRGGAVIDRLQRLYNAISSDIVGRTGEPAFGTLGWFMNALSDNVSRALITLNETATAIQTISGLYTLGYPNLIDSSHFKAAYFSNAWFDKSIDMKIMQIPYLRSRLQGTGESRISQGPGRTQSPIAGVGQSPRDAVLFGWIKAADSAAIRVIWKSAENQVRADAALAGEELSNKALVERTGEIVMYIVKDSQPTNDPLHTSSVAVEARTSSMAKYLGKFRNQLSKLWSSTLFEIETIRKSPSKMERMVAYRRLFIRYVLANFMMAMARETMDFIFTQGIPALIDGEELDDEWFEEMPKRIASRMTEQGLAPFLIFGNMINFVLQKTVLDSDRAFSPDLAPGLSITEELGRAVFGMAEEVAGEDDESRLLERILNLYIALGTALGTSVAPARRVKRVEKSLRERAKVEEEVSEDEGE